VRPNISGFSAITASEAEPIGPSAMAAPMAASPVGRPTPSSASPWPRVISPAAVRRRLRRQHLLHAEQHDAGQAQAEQRQIGEQAALEPACRQRRGFSSSQMSRAQRGRHG
jgi:hypothetical protein